MKFIPNGRETVNTPRAALEVATLISTACFNDEIRAIVARELLSHMQHSALSRVFSGDNDVARAQIAAFEAVSALVVAFDRQYRD